MDVDAVAAHFGAQIVLPRLRVLVVDGMRTCQLVFAKTPVVGDGPVQRVGVEIDEDASVFPKPTLAPFAEPPWNLGGLFAPHVFGPATQGFPPTVGCVSYKLVGKEEGIEGWVAAA